ncbi:MAG: hydroxymethylbilane synthase [Burkholderiales bacterium]
MPLPDRIVIASRKSRLALWQSEHVRDLLVRVHPGMRVEILPLSTRGDEILDRSLAKIGGKGLFVKELEAALADGRADLAVHSAKDVPVALDAGFELAAILAREDPRDAFVSNAHAELAGLPRGAIVGTSSLRREAQLRARYPGLDVRPLRGNVETRLAKLDRGDYAAIVLAVAGLKRLGLADRIRAVIDPEVSLPAVGQGALAIECRAARTDLRELLALLHDPTTAACVRAERAVSRALGGSCQVPLAAYGEIADGTLRLRGVVASPDGARVVRGEVRGDPQAPEAAGEALAAELGRRGAAEILAALE